MSSKNNRSGSFYAIYIPESNLSTIVTSWEACETLVTGRSGARYKKFGSTHEATAFLAQFNTELAPVHAKTTPTSTATQHPKSVQQPTLSKDSTLKIKSINKTYSPPQAPTRPLNSLTTPSQHTTHAPPLQKNLFPDHSNTPKQNLALDKQTNEQIGEQTQKKSICYAVYLGKTKRSYILKTWKACEALVSGEPTAHFKKLRSYTEAETYLAQIQTQLSEQKTHTSHNPHTTWQALQHPKKFPANLVLSPQHHWNVYTDGSSVKAIPYVAWGWSLVCDEKTLIGEEIGFVKNNSGLANVEAELRAVLNALTTLSPHLSQHCNPTTAGTPNVPNPKLPSPPLTYLTISYDYTGIELWANDTWKAKTPFTRHYQETIKPFLKHIRFNKISAHGANLWNDHIDKLVRFQLKKFHNTRRT